MANVLQEISSISYVFFYDKIRFKHLLDRVKILISFIIIGLLHDYF